MRMSDQLVALRDDPARQEAVKSAAMSMRNAWAARPRVQALTAALAKYARGAAIEACEELAELVSVQDIARSFVEEWIGQVVALLEEHPLARHEFESRSGGGVSSVTLANAGRSRLDLIVSCAKDEDCDQQSRALQFASVERNEICLSGSAEILVGRLERDRLEIERRRLFAGDRLEFAADTMAKSVLSCSPGFAVLRLSRNSTDPSPTRDIRVSDGALLHQSSGDMSHSRSEIAMALLARMRRRDAVPAMMALAERGSDHLRWEAVRNCLALDVRQGFQVLAGIAASADDPLCAPAGALRAQLIEHHPQLLELETQTCPA